MSEVRWPGDWLRGVLALCVLSALAQGPTYGYAIGQRLAAAGLGTVRGGTLYPLLTRLEADGLVVSSWRQGEGGPGRKYFTLTQSGTAALAARAAAWTRFTDAVAELVPSAPDDPTAEAELAPTEAR